MSITVEDAVQQLYNVAIASGKAQSPSRLNVLAEYCVQELQQRGIRNVQTEVAVPGAARLLGRGSVSEKPECTGTRWKCKLIPLAPRK